MALAPDYPIRTERLTLRPLVLADAEALHTYRSIPDVCRYVPFEPMSRETVTERLRGSWSNPSLEAPGNMLGLGVVRNDTGELIGDVMVFWHSLEHRHGEVGWIFHPGHGGQGYATEAARACLGLLFEDLGLHRVTARIDARNESSAALAARLGMRLEAHLVENEWFKGEWSDELVYAMLESEWRGDPPPLS